MTIKLERYRYYLGTAKIQLANLYYSTLSTEPDDCIGCCVSDLEHNLPALIGFPEYQDCLTRAGISPDALYTVGHSPRLPLPGSFKVPCLHGRFRLETAKQNRSQGQHDWWLVDLYTSGESVINLPEFSC